jgi:hypothetical protein
MTLCKNCNARHPIQRCPEILDALLAPEPVEYTLDPFVSPGEIAIRIPGIPLFFEETYHEAELAARAWCALVRRPDAIVDVPMEIA